MRNHLKSFARRIALPGLLALTLGISSAESNGQVPMTGGGMEPKVTSSMPRIPLQTPAAATPQWQSTSPQSAPRLIAGAATCDAAGIKAAPRRVSATDVTGTWIISYQTLLEGGASGGGAVEVSASPTEENTYIIKDFWQKGLQIKATVDPSTGVITIPNQVFAHTQDGADVDITAIIPANGKPDRSTPITGTFNADGTISISTWWAVYLADKTEMSGGMFDAYYNTVLRKPNGTMTFMSDNEAQSMPVYAVQTADNVLEVTNILNGGLTIEMTLNRDLTATIALQTIVENNTAHYNICTYEIADGSVTFKSPITTDVATDTKVISWPRWTGYGLTADGKATWFGQLTDAKITLQNAVNYPKLNVTALQGEGTQDNPYLITSRDDLIFLADKVNGQPGSATGQEICTGEYYRMTADIDMSGHRFTAIAFDYYHMFNGVFDGDGHTISNLTIVSPSNTYAGLFGRTGKQSVIKNITFEKANINSQAFTGCAAAWSLGTVENINVNNSTIYNTNQGTGAVVNIATVIANCHVNMSDVTGLRGFVGGIAGQVNTSMSNCTATNMRIVGASPEKNPCPVGGLVGLANYPSVITDSYFSGTIDAFSKYTICYNGGVAGRAAGATIERCFFVGTIRGYGSDSFTGGIVGDAMSPTIIDCYANGRVDNGSSRRTGGLVGYLTNGTLNDEVIPASFKSSYSSAAMLAETYLYKPDTERRELLGTIADGAQYTVENCYFNKQLVNFGSTEYGVLTSDLVAAAGPAGFSADKWVFTQGQYPRLKGMENAEASLYSASALIMEPTSNLNKLSQNATFNVMGNTNFGYLDPAGQIVKKGYYSDVDGNTLVLNSDYRIGNDTIFIVNGRAQYHYFVKVAPIPFSGDGTEASPYLISTADDLIKLSQMTTVSGQTFPNTYFRMTNDIDLNYSMEFLGIMCDAEKTNEFSGYFDGGGYTVHRFKTGVPVWIKEPTETSVGEIDTQSLKMYQGFFGRLGASGTVCNLSLADDCQIILGGYSGAIVGYNFGRIENCRNYADVISYTGVYVGGITGYNNTGDKTAVVNCYNAGNITGGRYGVGGITGVNYRLVQNCVNTGDVTAKVLCTKYDATKNYLVGGITGSMTGRIENCINYGTVTGNDRVGGLSGSLDKATGTAEFKNDVVNCINVGIVRSASPATTGALGGVSGTDGEVSGNYWDAQILPIAAAANTNAPGMNGVETSKLTSGTALEGYSADIWDFSAGMYPALKSRVDEADVKSARSIIISIPAGKNAYNLTGTESTLASIEGMSWTLTDDNVFSIEGSVLKAPASVDAVVTNTLNASYGNVVKPILVKALPAIPIAGTGSEEDPYLITSTDDWNNLAGYMTLTANTLENCFVALTADIDFTDKSFTSLASDGVTFFNGTFDGRNHTVKGISLTAKATFAGAIGTIGSTGVVKNLTLSGKVTSTFGSVGGFSGRLYGTLDHCVNEVEVDGGAKAIAGGFAAVMYDNASLSSSVNKAAVSAQSNVGGFAGTFDKASKIVMTECVNDGAITGNTSNAYVGGIVGTAYPCTLTGCVNNGVVTVKNPASQSHAAGLIAFATGVKDAAPYTISGCSNTGAITAKSNVAGIVANVHATAGYTVLNISGCVNSGKITAKGTANTSNTANAGIASLLTPGSSVSDCTNNGEVTAGVNQYTAGIAGYPRVAGTKDNHITISGCSNSGAITGGSYYVAGIMANAAAYCYIDNCSNTGAVKGTDKAYALGGIVGGLTNANAAISDCWNTGAIVTPTNRAGGIVGMNAQKAAISNCWNGGDISSTSDIQGLGNTAGYAIGGVAGQGSSVFTNCYNFGTVTGASRVGGLIGAPTKNNTQLVNCYNAGRIIAPADTCGNLVGVALVNNGSIWTENNTITNSFYLSEFGVFANSEGAGTAVTAAQLVDTEMGEGWVKPAPYTFPVLQAFDGNLSQMFYAAALVPADGDSYDSITQGFHVGVPGDTQWSFSADVLSLEGNSASFAAPFTGEIIATVTSGDMSRTINLKADVKSTGIEEIGTDATQTEAEYFDLRGIRIAAPVSGEIYIVRRGQTVTKEVYGE